LQSHEWEKHHFLKNTEQYEVNFEVISVKIDEAKVRNNGEADPK
jgi:hypothetical protein